MTQATRNAVGLVGLGLVGRAIARRLRDAGFPVCGFDLRAEAREAFGQEGGIVFATVQEVAARCDCVVLAVFESKDVVEVCEGADGILAGDSRVRMLVDCSTGTPETLVALAARLRQRSIDFVEGPLSGSSQQIEAGEATQLLGGESDVIAKWLPVFEALSPRRIHVGAAGMAARAKLATNLVLGLNRAALAEGIAFAETQGFAPETFLALVLATPARSMAAEVKGPMMVAGRFEPQSRVRQHYKDVMLMLESASAAAQPLPLSQAHLEIMRRAIEAGDGDLDNAAIVRQWRRERGE